MRRGRTQQLCSPRGCGLGKWSSAVISPSSPCPTSAFLFRCAPSQVELEISNQTDVPDAPSHVCVLCAYSQVEGRQVEHPVRVVRSQVHDDDATSSLSSVRQVCLACSKRETMRTIPAKVSSLANTILCFLPKRASSGTLMGKVMCSSQIRWNSMPSRISCSFGIARPR